MTCCIKKPNKASITISQPILSSNSSQPSSSSSSVSSRPTISLSYSSDLESYNNNIDPSYRIIRCTSMDTVWRNEQIPSVNSNEKLSINRHHYQKGEFPLQKPRVYTQDDRSFVGQQQQPNVLSSSSASSTLSVKDKHIKEVGETRSYSVQDGCSVIGSARGVMDFYGGKLSCPLTGVSISVPVGAIPEGVQQEIYFQVCQDGSTIPAFNAEQGERFLSPIVMCGPRGVQFLKPVELILPHSAGTDAQLALMHHDANQNGSTMNQQDKPTILIEINHVTNSNVSILVDHF